jgi:hypothetical protein
MKGARFADVAAIQEFASFYVLLNPLGSYIGLRPAL